METSSTLSNKRKPGTRLLAAERTELLAKMAEQLLLGVYSDNKLSKVLGVDRSTVAKYKPSAVQLINAVKLDRNTVRALQVQRVYQRLEKLYDEAETAVTVKDRMAVHNQITKLEQHLALITGLNVETRVNVNHKQLVIFRADPKKVEKARKEAIEGHVIKSD